MMPHATVRARNWLTPSPRTAFNVATGPRSHMAHTMLRAVTTKATYSRRDYPLERWVAIVVPVIGAAGDPRTLDEWGRLCGLSSSGIKARCRAAGIRPKLVLDFCRLLRVVTSDHAGSSERRLLGQLNIVDERTLRSLLRRAGISTANLTSVTPREFLWSQRLVTDVDYLSALAVQVS